MPSPTSCSIALHRRHALGLGAAWAWGAPGTALALDHPLLRIETIELEPFGYHRNHEQGGLMYDISNLIARRAGLAFENRVTPYPRTVVSLEAGTADMVLRFANEELVRIAHQVAPILELPTVALSLQSTPHRTLDTLTGARIGLPRSFPIEGSLGAVPYVKLVPLANYDAILKMLFAGRLDAAYGSHLGLMAAGRRLELPMHLLGPAIATGRQVFWVHVSRKTASPERVEHLKRTCEALKQDGSIERIYRQHLARYGMPI